VGRIIRPQSGNSMKNKILKALEIILQAADEGYRKCESEVKDGVIGAEKSLKKYGDALTFDNCHYIETAVKYHKDLIEKLEDASGFILRFDELSDDDELAYSKKLSSFIEAIKEAEHSK
jgi:hypothetical protein